MHVRQHEYIQSNDFLKEEIKQKILTLMLEIHEFIVENT